MKSHSLIKKIWIWVKLHPCLFVFCIFFSLTRLIVEIFKLRQNKPQCKRRVIKNFHKRYFIFTTCICLFALFILPLIGKKIDLYFIFLKFSPKVKWVVFAYAVYRIVETILAFYCDSMRILEGKKQKTAIASIDRLKMAMRSYLSMCMEFTIIYFICRDGFECNHVQKISSMFDALYFSNATIMTIGYGDIAPTNNWLKLLSVGEGFCGLLMIVLAITMIGRAHV